MPNNTNRLGLPYILQSQAQKEVTHNEGLNILEAMLSTVTIDVANAPPASPANGDLYIVGTSPSGAFVGKAHKLAQYQVSGWVFYNPFKWQDAIIEAQDISLTFNGTIWQAYGQIAKDSGEYLRIQSWQEDVNLASATQTTNIIPNRSTVLAVNSRVITALAGSLPSFRVGVAGDTGRYGNSIGKAVDSTNIGLTYNPISYYATTPIALAPDSGTLTGGVVRINVQYIAFRGPWSW